jgi:hypothetical protein
MAKLNNQERVKNDFLLRTRNVTLMVNEWRGVVVLGLIVAAFLMSTVLTH